MSVSAQKRPHLEQDRRSKNIAPAPEKSERNHLLQLGNLIKKANLDHLDAQTLYGALLSIKDMTELKSNLNFWKRLADKTNSEG